MKIGVIIQGTLNDPFNLKKNVEQLLRFVPAEDIVISTWDTEYIAYDLPVHTIYSDIKAVETSTKYFKIMNLSSFAYQVFTTFAGLNYLQQQKEYDGFIKVRTDMYLEDYNVIFEQIKQNPGKVCSSSIFFRKNFPFHPGDFVIAGATGPFEAFWKASVDKLARMNRSDSELVLTGLDEKHYKKIIFPDPQSQVARLHRTNISTLPPETRLCINFLHSLGLDIECKDSPEMLKQYFSVIDFNKVGEFYVKSNNLKFVMSSDNKDNIEDVILNNPKYACNDCSDFIICDKRKNQGFLLNLVRSMVNSTDELATLTDDFDVFCAVYRGYLTVPEFEGKIEL